MCIQKICRESIPTNNKIEAAEEAINFAFGYLKNNKNILTENFADFLDKEEKCSSSNVCYNLSSGQYSFFNKSFVVIIKKGFIALYESNEDINDLCHLCCSIFQDDADRTPLFQFNWEENGKNFFHEQLDCDKYHQEIGTDFFNVWDYLDSTVEELQYLKKGLEKTVGLRSFFCLEKKKD